MAHHNQDIVVKFFDAYRRHDIDGIKSVMADNVTWSFPGQHPLAGVKKGIADVLEFFDAIGEIMDQSKTKVAKLITSENDHYVIECQHSTTNRDDGINLDHHSCVLWTIENGKISEGLHFFSDPKAVDKYFTSVTEMKYI